MNEIPVTIVTKNATQDNLTDQDYREIYEEQRQHNADTGLYGVSLDDFVEMIGSEFSKAAWSKYHRGQLELNRSMRNELRRAVGLPLLPPTVSDTIADVNPDAEVIRIGEDVPDRMFLVGTRKNFLIQLSDQWTIKPVTVVTSPPRTRKPVDRPWITQAQAEAQRRIGKSWKEVIDAGLKALETFCIQEGLIDGKID